MSLVSYNNNNDSDLEESTTPKPIQNPTNSKQLPRKLHQKPRRPVRITLPSLSEFNTDTTGSLKERKTVKRKASNLLDLLPPAASKPLLSSGKLIPTSVILKNPDSISTRIIPLKTADLSLTASDNALGNVNEMSRGIQWDCSTKIKISAVEAAPETLKPYTGLNNQAFRELVGNTKHKPVNEEKTERQELLKMLTDPVFEAKLASNSVNATCRIKNHITSLAQRALMNDKDLQAKWSENRHSRAQSRAKYGF